MASILSVCAQCETLNRVESSKAIAQKASCGKCGQLLPLHGLATEVSAGGLRKILAKADKPVLVDFWASWCGPCRVYSPIFEKASLKYQDAVFLKVNTEKYPALSSEFGIRGIPTTLVFKFGKEYQRQLGVIPDEAIPQLYS